jgi:DNA-binding beta-propeller fold protein YncE
MTKEDVMAFRTVVSFAAILAWGLPAHGQEGPPEGLAGTVVVVNKQGSDASFIDLETGSIVATVPTGAGPHELVVSPDGRTAVVTDYAGGNSLTVLDVAAGRSIRTIDLGAHPRPHGISFMPAGEVVAVTSEASQSVVLVRVSDGEVIANIATDAQGSHMLAVTADGSRIWTGDMGSNTVSELDVKIGAKLRALDAPAAPEAVNVTPDGRRVFAGSNDTGRVTPFDTSDGSATLVADGFAWPYRIFLTPGVELIIVPDLGNETLRFFDGDSYEELGRIDFPGEGPQGLTLHSDGRHLFQSLSRAGRIAVVDIHRREVVGYLPAGSGPDGIGYSGVTVAR